MGRLFRRVVRTARGPRRVKRAPAVRGAEGRQYRVVAVDEPENNEFADPPRKWGRVGILVAAWAAALALGAWVAPGFAASGNPENQDPRDEAASSAKNATNRYLRWGSDLDTDRAEAALCDDASPEVTPSDLDAIRQAYDDELHGITRIDATTGDPVSGSDGITVTGTVSYISDAKPVYEDFVVTVQEHDGEYCVSNAVRVQDDEPTSDDSTGEAVDPETLATEFMRSIVKDRNPEAASTSQCDSFTGITPGELDSAITEWASTNGQTTAYVNGIDPTESSETSVTTFDVDVTLDGGLNVETFAFTVGVQENCVASLAGGDGLL
jgi:hypothetical protein